MIKKLLPILVFFTCLAATAQETPEELQWQNLNKLVKSYFRSSPFEGEFSGFLKHLINDPTLQGKNTRMKTDTSFYMFRGMYTTHNPFSFKPKRVEVWLQETPVQYESADRTIDTIFFYHLLAYTDNNKKGEADILKEFEKIHRQNHRKFFGNDNDEIKEGGEVKVRMRNYFVPLHILSPFSVAWGKLNEQQEMVLTITVRFKISNNKAILPSPFNRP
jgi:hypothetical protein